jgi:Flp pilus assembly protein CpaB
VRSTPRAAVHAATLAVRRRLGESAALWWFVVLAAALAAGGVVVRSQRDASELRAAWGEVVPVLVARHDLRPGDPLDEATVVAGFLPRAAVPPGALSALPPVGAVARAAIPSGEIVHASRVAGTAGGPAGLLPPGTVGVAVPLDAGTGAVLGLAAGTWVDLLVTDPVSGQPGVGATGALVVGLGEGAAVVAVPEAQAPLAALAAAQGSAVLVLRVAPPSGGG